VHGAYLRPLSNAFSGPMFFCYRIAISEKGYVDVKMSVTTPVGHSSVPPPESSIGILAHAIARSVCGRDLLFVFLTCFCVHVSGKGNHR